MCAMILSARPLAADDFEPFGAVIATAPRGEAGSEANQGTARRFDWLADLQSSRPAAKPNLAAFRCAANDARPVPIRLLEKHPCSSQVFVPMNAARYLVVVARGGDAPDLSTLAAFIASGAQGICYAAGVWHHPMIALDRDTDFACLVWEDGGPEDCVVQDLAETIAIAID